MCVLGTYRAIIYFRPIVKYGICVCGIKTAAVNAENELMWRYLQCIVSSSSYIYIYIASKQTVEFCFVYSGYTHFNWIFCTCNKNIIDSIRRNVLNFMPSNLFVWRKKWIQFCIFCLHQFALWMFRIKYLTNSCATRNSKKKDNFKSGRRSAPLLPFRFFNIVASQK